MYFCKIAWSFLLRRNEGQSALVPYSCLRFYTEYETVLANFQETLGIFKKIFVTIKRADENNCYSKLEFVYECRY
jgi:hypothetical protein